MSYSAVHVAQTQCMQPVPRPHTGEAWHRACHSSYSTHLAGGRWGWRACSRRHPPRGPAAPPPPAQTQGPACAAALQSPHCYCRCYCCCCCCRCCCCRCHRCCCCAGTLLLQHPPPVVQPPQEQPVARSHCGMHWRDLQHGSTLGLVGTPCSPSVSVQCTWTSQASPQANYTRRPTCHPSRARY